MYLGHKSRPLRTDQTIRTVSSSKRRQCIHYTTMKTNGYLSIAMNVL